MKYLICRKVACWLVAACAALILPTKFASANDDLGTLQDLLPPSPDKKVNRSLNGRVRLFDNVLIHPMPVWSSFENGPAPAERSKIKTANKKGLYQMSMVPRDEDFGNWQNLFTIAAQQNDRRAVLQQGRIIANQFKAICSPSNMQIFNVHGSAKHLIQVVACGSFSRDRSKGQMATIVTLRNQTGLVTMTRQWRTAAFQSKVPSSWPIPKKELDNVIGELARSRLIPLKRKRG